MNPSLLPAVELLLKGTAILLAGGGGALFLARSSALHRSYWWLGIFATLFVLPLALVVPPLWTLPVRAGSPALVAATDPPSATAGPDATGPATVAAPPLSTPISLPQWLFAGYACGAGVVLGFRLLGSAQLWSLRCTARADADVQFLVDRWRKSTGMRRPVRVLTSSRITVPMTWGTWRPVILFPHDCRDWAPEELHAALEHELAHVGHFDAARRWLATLVGALWWFHPLAWVAARAWQLEQERACDDAVLRRGGDATAYARQLLTAAHSLRLSRFQAAAALIMAMPAGLEVRLRSVMNRAANRAPVRARSLIGLGTMTFLAMLGGVVIQAQSVGAAPATPAAAKSIEKKAAETIIPKIEFSQATPREVLEFIALKADLTIIYTTAAQEDARVTMSLANIPAAEAIKLVAGIAHLDVQYADGLVRITPHGGAPPNAKAITVEMRKPPGAPKVDSVVMARAQKIILPDVEIREATITEAIDFLRKKGLEADPEKRGVPIILQQNDTPASADVRITLSLHQVPLDEAVRYVANLANLKLRSGPNSLIVEPLTPAEARAAEAAMKASPAPPAPAR